MHYSSNEQIIEMITEIKFAITNSIRSSEERLSCFHCKGFDPEQWWEIYLVACTRRALLVCTHAMEWESPGRFFFPLIVNMLFVSIAILAGKGFVRFFCLCGFIMLCKMITNLHAWAEI